MADEGASGVRSVQMAMDILEVVAFSEEELGVTQVADRLRATKGSVHRHLHTLVERGYLSQNPVTSRYAIGPKSRLLARVAPETDLVHIAEGPMRELRDALGHTVVLSEATPRGALVVTKLTGFSPIEIGVRPGSELSFHASAQGKVVLAFSPRPFQVRALGRPLQVFTDKTVTSVPALENELIEIARRGVASAPEEAMLGINAVAAPIFDENDACIAALALVGSIQFLPREPKEADRTALLHAAEQISRRLGHGRRPDATPQKRKRASAR